MAGVAKRNEVVECRGCERGAPAGQRSEGEAKQCTRSVQPACTVSRKEKRAPKVVECRGCYYWRTMGNSSKCMHACHYCLETGNPRGMPAAECYKHEGTPYKPKKRGVKRDKGA